MFLHLNPDFCYWNRLGAKQKVKLATLNQNVTFSYIHFIPHGDCQK